MGVISKGVFLDYMFQFLKVLVNWRSRCTFSPSNLKTSDQCFSIINSGHLLPKPWNHLRINGCCLSLMLITKKCIEMIARKGISYKCEV